MHVAAFDFVRRIAQSLPPLYKVAEFGSRITNGTVREIFTDTRHGKYLGIDILEGPNVSLVTDAADWNGAGSWDCVVCCEVFEHTPRAKEICASAYRALRRGGSFIVTCATDPRPAHSAIGEDAPREDEFYRNVDLMSISDWLKSAGFDVVLFDIGSPSGDLYAFAMRVR